MYQVLLTSINGFSDLSDHSHISGDPEDTKCGRSIHP